MTFLEYVSNMFVKLITNSNAIFALVAIIVLTIAWYNSLVKERPPGPLGVPFLGYLPFLGPRPYKKFTELANKYGPVFSLYMGNSLVVVLNTYEGIKEAFIKQGDAFAGRPKGMIFNLIENDKYNVVITDGRIWKDHRRFALTVLRDCGVGKVSIEPLIMEEVQHFLNELKIINGAPTDFSEILSLSVSNNICILVFGKRFPYDDPWFVFVKRYFNEANSFSSTMTIFQFFQWMRNIPGIAKLVNQDSLSDSLGKLKASIYRLIKERKKHHVDGSRDNYINAFLTEQKSRDEKAEPNHAFSDEALEDNIRTIMAAGTGTTSNTLLWCLLYMMRYPEVQKKVQNEIDQVIGSNRTSCWNDRLRTPYTEATIYEVQRIATLAPDGIPHRNTEDCVILGQKIPKNSFIVSNLWAVHNDPTFWKDPQNFRPERFISEKGELILNEHFMPFSVGKRQCMGINLAQMEIYLYFTSMLQKFSFLAANDSAPNMEGITGLTFYPKCFCTRAVIRNANRNVLGICKLSRDTYAI